MRDVQIFSTDTDDGVVSVVSKTGNADHEIAAVAGDVAVVVPTLLLHPDTGPGRRAVEALVQQVRSEYGDHRVTVHQPLNSPEHVNDALRATGFSLDSALSVCANPADDGRRSRLPSDRPKLKTPRR